MRVLHVIASGGLYGAERVLLELAVEQQKLGHDPIIAFIGSSQDGERLLERAARERRLRARHIRLAPASKVRAARELLQLARDEAVDLIHTHGYKGNILLGFLPKRVRKFPLVTTVHGYTHVGSLNRLSLYEWIDRLALRRTDRVVLVHEAMAARRGLNRLHDRRWQVIENGITDDAVTAEALDEDIVRFCEGRSVIGAVGRLAPEKGLDVLLRAVGEIRHERDDVAALILGEGRARATLERLVDQLGLRDRVLMPGYRPHATSYLRFFKVFALPSLTEGLPIVLLEAMQAGVPIVATNVGGVPAVLDEGQAGLLVAAGDWQAFARALRRCLDDRVLASELATRSAAVVSSRFSSHTMARRYIELYTDLVGIREHPR